MFFSLAIALPLTAFIIAILTSSFLISDKVILTGKYEPKQSEIFDDEEEITLNSPLGECIFGKTKGDVVIYEIIY